MAQSPTIKLTNTIRRRSQRTLDQIREEVRGHATPEERYLEERVERSKIRLREASHDLDSRLRVASLASTVGLMLMRWRSRRKEQFKSRDRHRKRRWF
jgi:hypothetical protein